MIRVATRTLLLSLLLVPASGVTATVAEDPREAFAPDSSPSWLGAVGRLLIPSIRIEQGRRRHHIERCSATLVKRDGATSAQLIVTAWHCLEYYEDLSRDILFILPAEDGSNIEVSARRLESGGGMDADWAVLRLQRAIDTGPAAALPLHPNRLQPGARIIMAGFSRDAGTGAGGTVLSYDPQCRVTGTGAGRPGAHNLSSDCRAYKGASGGAVIGLSPSGQPLLSGVISRGDSSSLSEFVPSDRFRRAVLRHL